MEPREFVEKRVKRYMAEALEEFDREILRPLTRAAAVDRSRVDLAEILNRTQTVKRTFRKKLQAVGEDCVDLAPDDLVINDFELTRR